MYPGPTIIRACRKCHGLITEFTLMSGNTFGATFWTDGKMDAPMLPDAPALVRCPHCNVPLWIEDQKRVGEIDFFEKERTFKGARQGRVASARIFLLVLKEGVGSQERELYLRVRLWWAGNDKRRKGKSQAKLSARERENLEALSQLLDEGEPEGRVMKAEIMREMGRFDEAVSLLSGTIEEEVSVAANVIRDLALKKGSLVATVQESGAIYL
jgi:hypothetical protein